MRMHLACRCRYNYGNNNLISLIESSFFFKRSQPRHIMKLYSMKSSLSGGDMMIQAVAEGLTCTNAPPPLL